MANKLIFYTYHLIVLTICVDQGDGRWKTKDKENIRHDLEIFKEITEKIEQELKSFYDDYYDETPNKNANDINNQRYVKETGNEQQMKIKFQGSKKLNILHNNITTNVEAGDGNDYINNFSEQQTTMNTVNSKNILSNVPLKDNKIYKHGWPTFEEILLAMGKKYDWKNDRWIKVKNKFREITSSNIKKVIELNAKHKFSYRTVKLNRKSRRNVVIAVSAVR